MPHETREGRPDSTPVLLAWGLPPGEGTESALDDMLLWVTGGAGLLLWTGFALWLTG
jgi:hypothetical protein